MLATGGLKGTIPGRDSRKGGDLRSILIRFWAAITPAPTLCACCTGGRSESVTAPSWVRIRIAEQTKQACWCPSWSMDSDELAVSVLRDERGH